MGVMASSSIRCAWKFFMGLIAAVVALKSGIQGPPAIGTLLITADQLAPDRPTAYRVARDAEWFHYSASLFHAFTSPMKFSATS